MVAPAVAVFLLTGSSHFTADDLVNLRRAQLEDLSLDYLFSATSGHFAPGHLLGDWLLFRTAGFDFTAARGVLAVGFAASLLLFHRILVTLFATRLGAVVLTLLYGLSAVHVSALQWWASGLDRVPADLAAFSSILLYLAWVRSRSPLALAGSLAGLGVALLFYVKPVFVPYYLFLIHVLVLQPARPLADTLRDALSRWRVWLSFAAVVSALAAVYVSYYPDYRPDRSLTALADYLGTLWFRVFAPNLFGLFVPQGAMNASGWATAVLAQAGLLAIAVATIWRRRSAWKAWAFFAAAAAPNALVVGATRIGFFGPQEIAYANFFNRELVLLFFFAFAAAVFPAREWPPHPAPGAELRQRTPSRTAASWTAVGTATLAVTSLTLGWHVAQPGQWVGAEFRPYLVNLGSELAGLGGQAGLVDGFVPEGLVTPLGSPYNNHSEIVPLLDPAASFDASRPILLDIGADGLLRPVAFQAAAGGSVLALVQNGEIGFAGGTVAPTQGGVCLRSESEPAILGFRPPVPVAEGTHLRLSYFTRAPTTLSLVVDPPSTFQGPRSTFARPRLARLPVESLTTRVFAVGTARVDLITIDISPGSQLCILELSLGTLVDGYSSPPA